MLEVIILFFATVVGYVYLQSRGGRRFAPTTSGQGKRERIVVGGLLAIIVVAALSVFMGQRASNRISTVAIPFMIGMLVFMAFYLKNRKNE